MVAADNYLGLSCAPGTDYTQIHILVTARKLILLCMML